MGNRASKNIKRSSTATQAPSVEPRQAPVGEWVSPITSASITEKAVKLTGASLRATDGAFFWLELRPSEFGRQALVMRSPDGAIRDITPPLTDSPSDTAYNVRTTVYEYGGGEYCVAGNTVYFVNYKDQALYAQGLMGEGGRASPPRLLTHESEARGERFADFSWDAGQRRLVAVSELHRDQTSGAELQPQEVINRLVAVDVSNGSVTPLVGGADFYHSPRVSPDGRWLAWVEWAFPNMPWDHTSLVVAPLLEDGAAGPHTRLAGVKAGAKDGSSVQQPVWSPDGSYLYFVDDKTGWWNLYRCRTPTASTTAEAGNGDGGWAAAMEAAEALFPQDAEWGFPAWTMDRRSYQVLSDGSVLGLFTAPKVVGTSMALLKPPPPLFADAAAGAVDAGLSGGAVAGSAVGGEAGAGAAPKAAEWQLFAIDTGFTHYDGYRLVVNEAPSGTVTVAAVAASTARGSAVVQLTAPSAAALTASKAADWQVLRTASSLQIPEGYISTPEALEFPTIFDGKPATAHMLYYPPTNKDFTYPSGVLPPLLVKSHGGPTSAAVPTLNGSLQYWTSRGFAIADINYGGSTGFGTEYRNRLNGRWGVVDVEDCCKAAEWLVSAGRVDPKRLCISGGSAGGYTTLACLAFRKTFSAGASHYGVADLAMLARDTHKMESRYLDNLVGPLPEAAATYEARSPLHNVEGFSSPVIFFQGDEDKVVPPEQAIAMHAAIMAAGLPTALVMLKGEQHGFRQAVNIRTALDGEMYFYGAALGFPAAMPEDLPQIPLDNMPQLEPKPQSVEELMAAEAETAQ